MRDLGTYPFRTPEEQAEQPTATQQSTAIRILEELVKSYGFGRDQDGYWEWSPARIANSFKDDPFWTTLDWLAIAAPVTKWGTAARQLEKGMGIAGQAYKAGEYVGRAPEGAYGKLAARFMGDEKAFAAQQAMAAPSPGLTRVATSGTRFEDAGERVGRVFDKFRNPIALQFDEDYMRLAEDDLRPGPYRTSRGTFRPKFELSPWERRGIAQSHRREMLLEQAAWGRQAADNQREWNRVERALRREEGMSKGLAAARANQIRRKAGAMLKEGIDPDDYLIAALGRHTQAAYRRTWDFRNTAHNEGYALGLISKEAYGKGYQKYAPRLYEEFLKLQEAIAALRPPRGSAALATSKTTQAAKGAAEVAPKGAAAVTERTGWHRFLARGKEKKALTSVLDPRVTLEELSMVGNIIASRRYAMRMTESVIARDPEDMVRLVEEILGGNDLLRRAHGISAAQVAAAKNIIDAAGEAHRTVAGEEIARRLGWMKGEALFEGGSKVKKFIPDEFMEKWIDPAAAVDVAGTFKWANDTGEFYNFYQKALAYFRASKTAYNPATHVRNLFGANVFHHLVVGGVPFKPPTRGINSFLKHDHWMDEGIESGVLSASFDQEIREALRKGYGVNLNKKLKNATAVDWLPDNFAGEWIKGQASKAERLYRSIDEVYKLDAWIRQTEKYQKAGKTLDEAKALALVDINKFMPTFAMHSEFADAVRGAIPFASFTTESLRIWKNALTEKPHLAFFWAHFTEAMTETFGAMAGFSGEELDAAVASMPDYMNNKKLMALPINVDGKPKFIDMSYLIPMANMVEGVQSGELFFDTLIDPSANPAFSMSAAALTGKDPFTKRDLQPSMTERMIGQPVVGETPRRVVGLAEHSLRLMAPPLAPGGYAFQNLWELAGGVKSGYTGEPYEQGVARTIAANVAGMRIYEPSVENQIQKVRAEEYETNAAMSQAWRRWEFAAANGRIDEMEREKARIIAMKNADGRDGVEYFTKALRRHTPGKGKLRSLSTKQLEEIVRRSGKIGELSDRDRRILGNLTAILQERGALSP